MDTDSCALELVRRQLRRQSGLSRLMRHRVLIVGLMMATFLAMACTSRTPATTTTAAPPVEGDGAELVALADYDGPRRQTSGSVPHVQLDVDAVPDVDAELRRRIFQLPGVENRESIISLPGATGLWLADDVAISRPGVMNAGREFAHIHPDGSLHVWLPVDRANEVEQKKWGELHPWVVRDGFWGGVVMVFSPQTLDELDTTIRIVVDSYNFITGASVDASSLGG